MSSNDYFYQNEIRGYQELSFGDVNKNLVCIGVENPIYYEAITNSEYREVVLGIDPEEFDKLAIAWCKRRMLSI
jgi:hypothetical protein